MSALTGDKARFNRNRKRNAAARVAMRLLRASFATPAPVAPEPAKALKSPPAVAPPLDA